MRQGVQMAEQTIRAGDLALVLGSIKLNQFTKGKTCRLAAMTAAPMLEVDCAHGRNPLIHSPGFYAEAVRFAAAGKTGPRVVPWNRGLVATVIERVAREGGRREVLKTFGAGIQALRREPRHVLRVAA
jgi:hypothetical protein